MTRYDYLVKHGNLTRYRSVNAAILEYGRKQDSQPLTNLDVRRVLMECQARANMYGLLEAAMLKNPFEFNARQWLHDRDLYRVAARTNIYKSLRLIRDRQQVICNRILVGKPGMMTITRELIQQRLSAGELRLYDSWPGYQRIVDHLNHIPRWGASRPHKTKNLLIVGPPNTGKTALALQVKRYCPVYFKGVSTWFPAYKSGVYDMILWNEFTLRSMPFSEILNFLEGIAMDLQYKGGMTQRTDNQLVYMTSNWSLREHVLRRFRSAVDRQHAILSLGARVQEVTIPEGCDLFLLVKLVVQARGEPA